MANQTTQYVDILLVEDDYSIIEIFNKLASNHEISVITTGNTGGFLSAIKEHTFKILLIDINLDYEFEGFDIANIYHNLSNKEKNNSKLVAFTGMKLPEEFFSKKGFDSVIYKNLPDMIDFISDFKEQFLTP